MQYSLEEILYAWALHRAPELLMDEDAFTGLILLVHGLLRESLQKERASARRALRPSPS